MSKEREKAFKQFLEEQGWTKEVPVDGHSRDLFDAGWKAYEGVTPLCAVHKRLEEIDQLEVRYGNDCVACSLHERRELLDILEASGVSTATDSVTAMQKVCAAAQENLCPRVAGEWVEVKSGKLPEIGERVMVVRDNGWIEMDTRHADRYSVTFAGPVVAWMPIPPFTKPDTKDDRCPSVLPDSRFPVRCTLKVGHGGNRHGGGGCEWRKTAAELSEVITKPDTPKVDDRLHLTVEPWTPDVCEEEGRMQSQQAWFNGLQYHHPGSYSRLCDRCGEFFTAGDGVVNQATYHFKRLCETKEEKPHAR